MKILISPVALLRYCGDVAGGGRGGRRRFNDGKEIANMFELETNRRGVTGILGSARVKRIEV